MITASIMGSNLFVNTSCYFNTILICNLLDRTIALAIILISFEHLLAATLIKNLCLAEHINMNPVASTLLYRQQEMTLSDYSLFIL